MGLFQKTPIGSVAAPDRTSIGTSCALPCAANVARDWVQSSKSAPGPPAASLKRSASRKSFLRPRRPRLDCACARCSVPDFRLAPSRFSQIGFQYRSSASHTGFQYWAVDSMTTSSACCSTSHAASDRSCSGLLQNIRRSNWNSPSISELPTYPLGTYPEITRTMKRAMPSPFTL